VTSDNSHYSIVKDLLTLSTYYASKLQHSRGELKTLSQPTWLPSLEGSSFGRSLNRQSAIANRQCHGGGEGIRTPDPRVANAVLCQLSYTPETLPIGDCQFQVSSAPIGNWKSADEMVAGAGFEPATFGL
jgi:hypothetical protein